MFGPNMAEKYAWAVTKNWFLGVNFSHALQAISLSLIRPLCQKRKIFDIEKETYGWK